MGDRVNCTLTIYGNMSELSADIRANIEALIEELDPTNGVNLEDTMEFEEINYGDMPGALVCALKDANLSFVWTYQAGGGFGEGMEIYLAAEDDDFYYNTNAGEICILVTDIGTHKALNAIRVNEWLTEQRQKRAVEILARENAMKVAA
jgi:hypothetical protein